MTRKIPGRSSTCGRCGEPITWARTVATENGRGGKPMPLNPHEDPKGNVAVRPVNDRGGLVARVLRNGESEDRTLELRAMPHFATCAPELPIPKPEPPANVIPFGDRAARARARQAAQPRGSHP